MPVGQKLEEARKRKGVSLREVSESTKIRGDYLSAIESGNLEINLPEVYLRGFVRLYAKFLGLDQDAMVAELDADLGKSGSRSSKKTLGSIVSQDHSENQAKSYSPANSTPSSKRVSSKKNLPSLPIILSLVGVAVCSFVILIIYLFSEGDTPDIDEDIQASISEVSNDSTQNDQSPTEALPDSHLLKISITGDTAKLIVCDEGKNPPVFHEFDNLASGWSQEIEFEKSFRCYSSQIENLTISVDGNNSQKVGGDRTGVGTFSWKPTN